MMLMVKHMYDVDDEERSLEGQDSFIDKIVSSSEENAAAKV